MFVCFFFGGFFCIKMKVSIHYCDLEISIKKNDIPWRLVQHYVHGRIMKSLLITAEYTVVEWLWNGYVCDTYVGLDVSTLMAV